MANPFEIMKKAMGNKGPLGKEGAAPAKELPAFLKKGKKDAGKKIPTKKG